MAFTEDSLKAKLSSLNETQDSISSVGQWILFHRYCALCLYVCMVAMC